MISFLLSVGVPSAVARDAVPCEIKITTPQPGDKVGEEGEVGGTAKIPGGTYLWVLSHRKNLSADWWPQGMHAAAIDADGKWVVVSAYGRAKDVGKQFEVAAVAVDGETNTKLREWFKTAKERDYPPIEFPDAVGGCVPVKVTVNKTSH